MKTSLFHFTNNQWIKHSNSEVADNNKVQLALCFAGKDVFIEEPIFPLLKKQFPLANIAMCSTAGEIYQNSVFDNTMVVAALEFEKTSLQTASVNIKDFISRFDAAVALGNKLPKEGLSYILVLSDGSLVNGSDLVKGINSVVGDDVLITGGLAGDGANFNSTLVGVNEEPAEGKIIAIGFYGKNLIVTHGSQGGWDMFGLEKKITRSEANVLFEIDNQNALELYKNYLGPDAENLPGSALLFPLSVTVPGSDKPVVRTILSIDENEKSMTFAGDVPEGSVVRFMKANFDKLTIAASSAASQTILANNIKPGFALLISCVGRKLILGPRLEEETEAVDQTFGEKTLLAGFYSYGEISPFNEGGRCQLHNQTMTITSFYELP